MKGGRQLTFGNVPAQHAYGHTSNPTVDRLASGLGWFSVGLGLAEVIAPGTVAGLIGIKPKQKTENLLRLYGLRELAAGIGILTQARPSGSLWARVAGDAVDLASLASAMANNRNDEGKLTFALASVAGITAADIYCAKQLSAAKSANGASQPTSSRVVRTIIVNCSPEQAYNYWHNVENLPRFMTYLDSVRSTGDRRTHWVANGPAGTHIEWDAETVNDEPNRMVAWKAVDGSQFEHMGSVKFEPAPGQRGTLVRVTMDYSSTRTAAAMGKLLKMDIGRRINHDLRNFKQMLEVGEVTQSEASVHPGMHAAQPEPVH